MGLRFVSSTPNYDDALQRRTAALARDPVVGDRVRIANAGSKYNPKDFAASFEEQKPTYTEKVVTGTYGVVCAVAEHFKRQGQFVFLVKFDNNESAVLARKGVEVAFWEGAYVNIVNTSARYAAKDFQKHFPQNTLVDIDTKAQGRRGVIVRMVPHFRKPEVTVFLVTADAKLNCVVMNGKGLTACPIPGLEQYRQKKEKEEAAAAAAEAAAPSSEQNGVATDAKRKV